MKRAEVLWELGLGDQAFAAFDRVLELHPNLVQAMLMKAELHDRLGRREDFAAAWHLIHVRARRIMPLSPEVHYAAGQHLMLMAERIPDHAEFYRGQAIAQFEFVSEAREYAPNARLALAAALLDRGDPLPKLMAVLALAERDASAAPAYLARCARLYGDPRLGAHGGGMFGPAGQKTQALWQRVLELTRGGHADARMETMLAPWHQWRAGNSAGTRPELGEVLTWFESRVRTDPQAVLPRYYLALILEDMARMGEAQIQWANLVRYVGRGGRLSTFWKGKILFEAGEFSRRLEQARGSTPTGGK